MNCHSRNIPGICRYIPGIYQKLKRGQAAGSDRNPGPLAFYRGPALCLLLSLTSTYIPDFFCRDVHILLFLILWISSISHVSRMTKGNEASRAASQKGERNHEEKRKGNMKQIPQMIVTTTKQLKKRHRNSERMNASADWHKQRLTAS